MVVADLSGSNHHNMALRHQKATVWDLNPLIELHFAVFQEIDPFERRLYPDVLTNKLMEENHEKFRDAMRVEEKQIWTRTVTEDNTIIAFTR